MILDKKVSLGFLPTPLHYMKNLSKKYNGYNIYIKRDDQTGLASGGNKTRKLEYLLYEAKELNCDTLITAGAQQSNHCRQTAAAAAVAGMECHLMLDGTDSEKYNGNLLLSHLLGAKFHFNEGKRKGEDMALLKAELEKKGKKCYIIPYGGSNTIGMLGYINAVKELKQQLNELNLKADYIFFSSSSGGTQAGITLGKDLFELNAQLMPVSIDKSETNGLSLEQNVLQIVNEGKHQLNIKKEYQLSDVNLIKGYDDKPYGVVSEDEVFAINEFALSEGIILDPVYTARAAFGMFDMMKNKKIKENSNVLFWHTGGLPANFYYADKLHQ